MTRIKKILQFSGIFCLPYLAGVASAQSQNVGFVYVTNAGGNSGPSAGSISAYSVDGQTGVLLPVPGSPFSDPGGPRSIALDPRGRFAYAANRGNDTISAYAIDRTTGILTPIPGSPFSQDSTVNGEWPVSVAVDPSGKFLFVANYNFATVRAYQIDQNTGSLTQAPGSPFPAGTVPQSVTVDLTGRFVYVANGYRNGNGTVSAYSMDPRMGTLTPVPGSPFSVPADPSKPGFPAPGSAPVSVTVHGTTAGEALYVADSFQSDIWEYIIDETTGVLALSPAAPFSVPGGPYSVAADPAALFLYASSAGLEASNGNVAGYAIDSVTGSLAVVPGSPFLAGSVPVGAVADPAGRFVFVANQGSYLDAFSGTVSAYRVDENTGGLTPVLGSPFASGLEPTSIAVMMAHSAGLPHPPDELGKGHKMAQPSSTGGN